MAKQTITISIYKDALRYDIENKTWLVGRRMLAADDSSYKVASQAQMDDDDENEAQMLRSLSQAWATVQVQLAEWLDSSSVVANNEVLDDGNTLTLQLRMPMNYDNAVNDTIAMAVHQYMANMVIADWYNLTNKAEAADYMTLAAANLEQLQVAIHKRVRPSRPV